MGIDATLAALTSLAVVVGAAIAGDFSHGGTVPLAASLGLVLLVRRRWPVPVLVCSVALVVSFGSADLGSPGWVWPATAAYVTVVLAGGLWWALGAGVATLATMTPFVPSAWVGVEALWLALVLIGSYAYADRARHRVTEERLVIARELHDVVAHTLAVVGIHLNVAADTLDDDPEEARTALRLAQSVRGQAMADLRSLVGILRSGPLPDGVPDLAELVSQTSATGLPVRLVGDLAGVPAPVALAAYRVAQEGLTNVLKHAHASAAVVTVTREATAITVSVRDDGRGVPVPQAGPATQGGSLPQVGPATRSGPVAEGGSAAEAGPVTRSGPVAGGGSVRHGASATEAGLVAEGGPIAEGGSARQGGSVAQGGPVPQGGYGLAGMRERVAALGGTLTSTSPAGGGFELVARLPLP